MKWLTLCGDMWDEFNNEQDVGIMKSILAEMELCKCSSKQDVMAYCKARIQEFETVKIKS